MSRAMRILVTGASGFIGSAIAGRLSQDGCRVFATSRNRSEIHGDSVLFLDLSTPQCIRELSDTHRFDAIVHFGAKIGWGEFGLEDLQVPNVDATGRLAEMAHNQDALLVFASGVLVHGTRATAINPGMSIDPDTPYGQSKWLAEEQIRASGARHCILRIGGVFGLNGPDHLGVNRAITGALNGTAPSIHGTGAALRNYIYVWDVAAAVSHAVHQAVEGCHLLAGSERISIRNMLEQIGAVLLEGRRPDEQPGGDASDQVIVPSPDLPETRPFKAALEDIQQKAVAS